MNHASHLTGFRGPDGGPPRKRPAQAQLEKQFVAVMSKAVQVSVSIPRDYLREIASRQVAKGEKSPERINLGFIEEDVLSKVEQIVGRLIPADSPGDAISVTCVDRLASRRTRGRAAVDQ